MVAGTAGLAAALGTGAYAVTTQYLATSPQHTSQETMQIDSPAVPSEPSPSIDPGVRPGTSPTPSPAAATSAAQKALPADVADEIKEARRKMAADGVPVKPPITPKVTQTAENVRVTTKGSLKEGGIVRMMTAREDLTGQRELAYVAGGIRDHRDVPCSQTFRFSNNETPKKRDNLLMCWRTSPDKSVVAIVVDPDGKPSRDKAVDALEKEWQRMK